MSEGAMLKRLKGSGSLTECRREGETEMPKLGRRLSIIGNPPVVGTTKVVPNRPLKS